MSIIAEAPEFLQVFSDGRVKRFEPEIAQTTFRASRDGYECKDVTIDPSKPLTCRVFLPKNPTLNEQGKLPTIVYFHGGGFCIGSTKWLGYHIFLGDMAASAQAIVVSIDYRLAPENRLPTAYLDCYASLEWLSQQAKLEGSLLSIADLSHVFMSGDSAGGNIAHNVAIHAIREKKACPNHHLNLKIEGLLLVHPYFGSERRTEKEMASEASRSVEMNDMFWRLSIPKGFNRDYYGCNFEFNDLSDKEWQGFPRVVVYVAVLDFLMERGVAYAEFLRKKGVKEAELVRVEGEEHIYHVFKPESEATRQLQKHMGKFINNVLTSSVA